MPTNDPILDWPWLREIINEILLPIGLVVMLLVGLYVANDCSCTLPHYDNTPANSP